MSARKGVSARRASIKIGRSLKFAAKYLRTGPGVL
jgi:hypothetical protein